MSSDPIWRRLWESLQEPRKVTAVQSVIYAVVAAMGLVALTTPPMTIENAWGGPLTKAWATILTVGALMSLAGCLIGHWWLEVRSLWLVWTGVGLYVGLVTSLHVTSAGNRLTQALALVALLLFFVTRYLRIRDFALDPTRGRTDHDDEPA